MINDSISFVNCTSFDVNLYNAADYNQLLHTYPASKNPVLHAITTEVVNLPEPKPNTYYIVFKKIAKAFPERKDLVFPGTPKTVIWDDANGIVANVNCVNFSRIED